MSHVSAVPREARPYQGHRAGLVTRFLAAAVDAVVVVVGLVGVYAGWALVLFLAHPRRLSLPDVEPVLGVLSWYVVLAVYLTAAWAVTGRSYGNRLMGLRVVDRHGGRLHVPTAFLRAAFYVVFPIGLVWVAGSRQNRSLQDTVLRTSVIHDWTTRWRGEADAVVETPPAPEETPESPAPSS